MIVCQPDWLYNSVLWNMQRAIDIVLPLFPRLLNTSTVQIPTQHIIHNKLKEVDKDGYCVSLIASRLTRFFPEAGDMTCYIPHIVDSYKQACRSMKQGIVMAHARIAMNQWCTARRYGQTRRACLFCGEARDELEHIVQCPKLHYHINSSMNQRMLWLSTESLLLFRHMGIPLSMPIIRYALIFECLAFNCYNSCRHGAAFNLKLVRFHAKRLAVRCNKTRNCIVWFRTNRLTLPTPNASTSSACLPICFR